MITHLTEVIYTPKLLNLTLRVGRYTSYQHLHQALKEQQIRTSEPRQSKRAILERSLRILSQHLLHLVTLRHLKNFSRLLITTHNGLDNSMHSLRFSRIIPMNPETLPKERYCTLDLVWMRQLESYKSALDGQRVDRKIWWRSLGDGDVKVFCPADAFVVDPMRFIY